MCNHAIKIYLLHNERKRTDALSESEHLILNSFHQFCVYTGFTYSYNLLVAELIIGLQKDLEEIYQDFKAADISGMAKETRLV